MANGRFELNAASVSLSPITNMSGKMFVIIGDWKAFKTDVFIISVLLVIVAAGTAFGAYMWLTDPKTQDATFIQSLLNHLFFTVAASALSKVTVWQGQIYMWNPGLWKLAGPCLSHST